MTEVKKNAVVLIYSGGLDTSICIPLMREEYGYEKVYTVTVDVGQPREEIIQAEEKARSLGSEHKTVDAREIFIRDFCFKGLQANAQYQGYPMSTSLARPIIGKMAAEMGVKHGVFAFAHGCTGKGNDQFRIETALRAEIPSAIIHAPIRDRNMTRKWEIDYALSKGVPISQSVEKIWSIDENLWGRSIEGGQLEDPLYQPPEEIFSWTKNPFETGRSPEKIVIRFKKGIPVALDDVSLAPHELVAALNKKAGAHGIGRIDIMEDRIMGLKVRENYECPAAIVLLFAHKALESLVLSRDEIRFKALVDQEWSRLVYDGLWSEPLREDLSAFIEKTQERVSGDVHLRLGSGTVSVTGRTSPWSLYSEKMASFESQDFDQKLSAGWVECFGLQGRYYQTLRASQREL